jgi:hypothetical protein
MSLKRPLVVVEVWARFDDKKRKNKFLDSDRWIDEGRQTYGVSFDMAYALRFACIASPEP